MTKYKVKFKKGKPLINPAHKGMLHQDTGTPADEKIPAKKIAAAENSDDPAVRRRAVFAANAASWGPKHKITVKTKA